MNAYTLGSPQNGSSVDGEITKRLRYLPVGVRWEILKHYWRGGSKSGWSGLEEAYADWARSSGAQWMSREKDRESGNAAAISSGEALLALLRDLSSDRSLNDAAGQDIQEIVLAIEKPGAALVFGGHFKAGKSSTLNAAIGRTILPSGRLPETGAMCSIQSGVEDSATVRRSGQAVTVECSMEVIRSVCSIVDRETGGKRNLSDVDRIEVALEGACIPKDLVWIDSPGITDDHAMDECATRAAAEGDVLVWVLWTKHPIGESEAAFLRRHLNEKGAASVVFLLNCFLAEDREEVWNEYFDQDVPRIWKKLEGVIGPMGFSDDVPLVMVPISARAIRDVDKNSFGGPDLCELMRQFESPRHARFMRTRWHRASIALDGLAVKYQEQLDFVRQEDAKLVAQLRLAKKEARRAETALLQTVKAHLLEFSLEWSQGARRAAHVLAGELTMLNLWNYAGKHGLELAQRVNRLGDAPYFHLCQAIERDLIQQGCQSVASNKIHELLEPLRSHSLENDVPKVELNSKAWAKYGGAAGVVFLAVHPVGIAMLLGGGVMAVSSVNKQLERIRQSISAAAEKFVLELEQKLDEMAVRLVARFSQCPDIAVEPVCNRSQEQKLEVLSRRLRAMAEQARKVADSFII